MQYYDLKHDLIDYFIKEKYMPTFDMNTCKDTLNNIQKLSVTLRKVLVFR